MRQFVYSPSAPLELNGHVFHCPRPDDLPLAKTCPFCGSEDVEIGNTHTPYYWAECQECGAKVDSTFDPGTKNHNDIKIHTQSFLGAVEAWNTRA